MRMKLRLSLPGWPGRTTAMHNGGWEHQVKIVATILALLGFLLTDALAQPAKPTIVLVHGAFADSSSWNEVIAILERDGYPVIAAANPLRSVKGDADSVRSLLDTIKTPVVLVGTPMEAWSSATPRAARRM